MSAIYAQRMPASKDNRPVFEHGFRERNRIPHARRRRAALPPPRSTYASKSLPQSISRRSLEQYCLPYTIARPFNCVGIGERRRCAIAMSPSGNLKLAMSHIVPDLVQKVLRDRIRCISWARADQVRHYTYAAIWPVGYGFVWSISRTEPGFQSFDAPADDCARISRADLAEDPWRSEAFSLLERPSL